MNSPVFADLAATNPISYFNLVEYVCRRELFEWESLAVPAMMLRLPFLFIGENRDRLISTWPSIKTYASAYASWIKAYVWLLAEAHTSPAAAEVAAVDPERVAASTAVAEARTKAAAEAAERHPAAGSAEAYELSGLLASAAAAAAGAQAAAVGPAAFQALVTAGRLCTCLGCSCPG